MILQSVQPVIDKDAFHQRTGWLAKPEGLCKGDVCVPAAEADLGDGHLDLRVVAERLRMPLVHDDAHGLWALGPESGGRALTSAHAPEITLTDLDGNPFRLSSRRGRKVVLHAWASWCGCRTALPAWQALHAEFEPSGLTVVTVALDIDPAKARPWIEAAAPTHPSVVDTAHVTDELLGFVNVPMAVWIDESGTLVRPAEPAWIERSPLRDADIPDGLPDRLAAMLREVKKIPGDPVGYRAAIVDWVERGAESPHALKPDEVVAASRPRPIEHAEAAACFELGQHLWGTVGHDAAVPWWREAHRLFPNNWTYKRQAWTLVTTPEGQPSDLIQGPNDVYEGNWLDDVVATGGGAHYYD